MKFLKAKLYQETAVYRNHMTMENIETYPLPPFSTVLGFLHNLVKSKSTIADIKISIQGTYSSLIRDYQWYKKPKGTGWTQYPIIVNALNEVNLILHVQSNDEMMEQFYLAMQNPPFYMHLGRAEDLVKISEVKYVHAEKKEVEKVTFPAYIPESLAADLEINGVLFSLPTYYIFQDIVVDKEVKKVRDFSWQSYLYVEPREIESDAKIFVDEDNLPLWIWI